MKKKSDNKNILTKEETESLLEALQKPVNEPSIQISLLMMDLSIISTEIFLINEKAGYFKIRSIHYKIKKILVEKIKEFTKVYKAHKGDFIEIDNDWEDYQKEIEKLKNILQEKYAENPNIEPIVNLWNSTIPIIEKFVRIFTNHNN